MTEAVSLLCPLVGMTHRAVAGRAGPTVSLKLSPHQSLASTPRWVWTAGHWVQVQNPAPWPLNMGTCDAWKCTHTHQAGHLWARH